MSFQEFLEAGFANNLTFFEEVYEKYLKDPSNVSSSWRRLFEALEQGREVSKKPMPSPSLAPQAAADVFFVAPQRVSPKVKAAISDIRVFNLIQAYRIYGHLLAKVNPIATHEVKELRQLKLNTLGFREEELTHSFPTFGLLAEEEAPLQQIIDALRSIYCDKIGVEYMGLQSPEMESWLQQQIEPTHFKIDLTIDQKRMILQHLNKSELFEVFLHTKYVGQKRFSLEGGETLIPILAAIVEMGCDLGLEEFVVGMAHRGRLNVLSNILNKSYAEIFSEFEDFYIPESFEGSGDVKYHKGFSSEVCTTAGKCVKIILNPNPSHLEAVYPVVEGQTKAKQILKGDPQGQEAVVPIVIHGDASITGQGVVYEAMQMYRLEGYTTGGTIHIVVNNQIGFTTLPEDGRSTPYCTDIARTFSAPVFHVNAEDPEGCVYATKLAVELRQKFHCDVFIDLNCYRKFGHNETDEPAFTQPLQYQIIRKKKPTREIYRDDLIQQGVLERRMAEALEKDFKESLQQALKGIKPQEEETQETQKPIAVQKTQKLDFFEPFKTAVARHILHTVAEKFCAVPEGFHLHKKLERLTKERLEMVTEGKESRPVDWGMAEFLAYATLLWEGVYVRLAGQDSCRGTFSHRHAMWMDQQEERKYFPLQHLKEGQGRFDAINSPLSEYAALGFEFGYNLANIDSLVLWEAQFGDFCNGAQVVIDQFIATAEQKWGKRSSLVLLLPHGYEGQGPEHSSARIERFLALCGNNNLLVVHPSTPAQFFHLLRRQVLWPIRKPLVVFTPKGLLRHPQCVNDLKDLTKGYFEEVLDDPIPAKQVKRLLLCSGHIYYDLLAERKEAKTDDVAVIRIEQLYPLHRERLQELIKKYRGFGECYWVQEEPSNMGAWDFIRPVLREILPKGQEIQYIGRKRSASPAAGSFAWHKAEHAALMKTIFGER